MSIDHDKTLEVFDAEEDSIMAYLDGLQDKSSKEYHDAVAALNILQQVKKNESEMSINELRSTLDQAKADADAEFKLKELEFRERHSENEFRLKERELDLRERDLDLESQRLDLDIAKGMAEIEHAESDAKIRRRTVTLDFVKGFGAAALLTVGTLAIRHGEMTGEAVMSGNAKQEVKTLVSGLLPKPR